MVEAETAQVGATWADVALVFLREFGPLLILALVAGTLVLLLLIFLFVWLKAAPGTIKVWGITLTKPEPPPPPPKPAPDPLSFEEIEQQLTIEERQVFQFIATYGESHARPEDLGLHELMFRDAQNRLVKRGLAVGGLHNIVLTHLGLEFGAELRRRMHNNS